VVKVRPGGAVPTDHATVVGGLMAPYGIAVRGDNAYVAINAVAKDVGQVIRFRL